MQEYELLRSLFVLIVCYAVFPFNLLKATIMAAWWNGQHFITSLVLLLKGRSGEERVYSV
jgi:hypothetical protein